MSAEDWCSGGGIVEGGLVTSCDYSQMTGARALAAGWQQFDNAPPGWHTANCMPANQLDAANPRLQYRWASDQAI